MRRTRSRGLEISPSWPCRVARTRTRWRISSSTTGTPPPSCGDGARAPSRDARDAAGPRRRNLETARPRPPHHPPHHRSLRSLVQSINHTILSLSLRLSRPFSVTPRSRGPRGVDESLTSRVMTRRIDPKGNLHACRPRDTMGRVTRRRRVRRRVRRRRESVAPVAFPRFLPSASSSSPNAPSIRFDSIRIRRRIRFVSRDG